MKKNFTLLIFLLLGSVSAFSQTCPDSQVRWLSGSGLFIMDWTTSGEATTMLGAINSIQIVDGCASANNGNFPCSTSTFLNDTQNASEFQIKNAGIETNNRIRPINNSLWSNGDGNNSGFTGTIVFNLTAGGSVTCNYENAVLPIELTSFRAKPMTNSVMLNWQTATEINNDYMAIERSADGKNYTEIGRVAGAGTTYDAQDYALEDRSPLKGMNYYRLRQVDYDGTTSYSKVVSVAFKTDGRPGELNVYPTVLKNGESLNIDFGEMSEEIQLDIFAASGQLMASQKIFAEGQTTILPINGLSDGMYILKTNGLNQNLTGRFFVKN